MINKIIEKINPNTIIVVALLILILVSVFSVESRLEQINFRLEDIDESINNIGSTSTINLKEYSAF